MDTHPRPPRGGLTLVELLVVVAVLAALLALLLPAAQAAREAGRRTACGNNLREIGCGIYGHEMARRVFPVGCLGCQGPPFPLRQVAWNVFVLPFVEQSAVATAFDARFSYRSVENRQAAGAVVPLFLCPSTSRTKRTGPTTGDRNRNGRWDAGDDLAFTDYGGLFGVGYPVPKPLPEHAGVLQYERPTSVRQVTDGLSHTALVAECTGRDATYQSEWANGQNIFDQWHTTGINRSQDNEIWSDHPGMAGMVFCDGHVAFVQESIDQAVLLALLTRAAGDRHEP
jgi:prepilin-type N-terminal cleavage/methylation domain-containing protein/prepilin-type processing-associated H-X9-DG protein